MSEHVDMRLGGQTSNFVVVKVWRRLLRRLA